MEKEKINKFKNEILVQSAAAALPGNLSTEWLNELHREASAIVGLVSQDILAFNLLEMSAPGIFGCVRRIREDQGQNGQAKINRALFFGQIKAYCVNVFFEAVSRDGKYLVEPANMDNIFASDRTARVDDYYEIDISCPQRFYCLVQSRQEREGERDDAE
ncbi:MAG: hypothetical protein C4519_21705 [Desulfobacteraceae bacterium]|nr:MAG: hypothetical protein C4519_21705 [Desulfobacteraceae bacterium]